MKAWLLALLALTTFASAAPGPGDRLAPFTLRTRQNEPFEWKPGRVTVITCCAFWCDTWKTQLPRVVEADKSTKGLPVDFLTVSVDGRWSEKGQAASAGTMLNDPGGKWTNENNIDRVPYTFVLDPNGTVTFASFGTLRSQDLIDKIRSALKGSQDGGVVYLTFDDFPAKSGNEELLDVLRAEQVPATFFCICQKTNAFAKTLKRALREGNSLQIHSWDHDAQNPELTRCQQALAEIGATPKLYRPPGSEQIKTLTGTVIQAKIVDPYDFSRPGAKELARRISLQARPGCVIQLHAGVEETRQILPEIIASLRKRGYTFALLQ